MNALRAELGGRAFYSLLWNDDPAMLAMRFVRAGHMPSVPWPLPPVLKDWP